VRSKFLQLLFPYAKENREEHLSDLLRKLRTFHSKHEIAVSRSYVTKNETKRTVKNSKCSSLNCRCKVSTFLQTFQKRNIEEVLTLLSNVCHRIYELLRSKHKVQIPLLLSLDLTAFGMNFSFHLWLFKSSFTSTNSNCLRNFPSNIISYTFDSFCMNFVGKITDLSSIGSV
jgi:hypothetical protein